MHKRWTSQICVLLIGLVSGAEIFKDPGFEGPKPYPIWDCAGCKMTPDTDHTEGRHSLKITGRQAAWAGPMQNVSLQTNTRYFVKAHIKQLNDVQGKLFQRVILTMDVMLSNGSHAYTDILENQRVRSESGWTVLSSYFMFTSTDFQSVNLRINGPDATVNFLVDDTSLTEISEDKSWKAKADARIDKIRKNNIHFNVHVPPHVSSEDLEVQVELVKHSFPFGSQTSSKTMNSYPHYADLFYYMFNWATVNDFYWQWSPPPQHNPDYSKAIKLLDTLHKHGVPVRGHNILWGTGDLFVPNWIKTLSSDQLQQAVDERLQYIVKDTKGKLQHWDVNNEQVHGHYFEDRTGDPDYTKKVFQKLHKADPDVKLFLNDYASVSAGKATSSYIAQAEDFKSANVGLYGLGVQCHFKPYTPPDPTLVLKRLDQLAAVGLPLWATEMDLVAHDENTRADWYDTALRLLFSHPAIEGIILWGFWDVDHWQGPDAALVNGPKFNVNAAGRRYIDLLYKEWSTHVTHKVSSGKQFDVRGFHGDYRIIVQYHGKPIMQQTFTLQKQDKTVDVHIQNVNHVIQLTTTVSPLVYDGVIKHTVAHINEYTLGHMTSGASKQLTCMTRYSGFSDVADDKFVEVGCPSGYVLTGCSGIIRNNQDTRDGESIDVQGGDAKCRSYDAAGSTAPVQAMARCCMLSGLSCEYMKSGPSEDVLNQRLETRCLHNKYATGCTAHSFLELSDGAFPSERSCFAQNHVNQGLVESYGACCSAPHMACKVKVSSPSGDKEGDEASVSCDKGWTLMGCSDYSEDSRLGGAYIAGTNEKCIAVNGGQRLPGEMGATAYATCCVVY